MLSPKYQKYFRPLIHMLWFIEPILVTSNRLLQVPKVALGDFLLRYVPAFAPW